MNFRPQGEQVQPALSMTPIIDVVLQLLLFFALTSSYVVNPGIKVDLPRSAASQLPQQPRELRLLLTAEGLLYVNSERATLEDLPARFAAHQAAGGEPSALIKADRRVTHGQVVAVMDAVKQAGFRIAIGTSPRVEQP